MRILAGGSAENACVRVRVHASDCEDTGIGLVLRRHPLTLIIPAHVGVLIEQSEAEYVEIDNIRHPVPEILSAPALERDGLIVVRFSPRSRHVIRLGEVELTRSRVFVDSGDPIELIAKSEDGVRNLRGRIQEIRGADGQSSILTDIPVTPGMSGAPILRDGQLAAVCQGRVSHGGGDGNAVAIPVSEEGLSDLRRIRARPGRRNMLWFLGLTLVLLLAVGSFAWHRFAVGGIEVSEDKRTLTVLNGAAFTLRPSWHRLFETKIHTHVAFASRSGGPIDRLAVGTWYDNGTPGFVFLFDTRGRLLWKATVPDDACIYPPEEEDLEQVGFQVTHIVPADLDGDGLKEILVSFVHNTWYPCTLMAFSSSGEPLTAYWHPGYIRTLAVNQGDRESLPIVVASASNNRLPAGWPHPQTLFAFRGLDISGQAPPYTGDGSRGSELWYRVIENIDSTVVRAKCKVIDLVDSDGDGHVEIRARTTDGRIYTLDATGQTLATTVADAFVISFGEIDPPILHVAPLVDDAEELAAYHRFASAIPGEHDRILLGLGDTLSLLDKKGVSLWTLPAPTGPDPVGMPTASSGSYRLSSVSTLDFDGDGHSEILAQYRHIVTQTTQIRVIDLSGAVRSTYWHAGPIEALEALALDESGSPTLVGVGSNHQWEGESEPVAVVFAFTGQPPSGVSPPYTDETQTGSQIWYRVLEPLDGSETPFENAVLGAVDADGDTPYEVEVRLSDGRSFFLNGAGETVPATGASSVAD